MQYNTALAIILGLLGTGSAFSTVTSRHDRAGIVLSSAGSTLAMAVATFMAWKNATAWIVLGIVGAVAVGLVLLSILVRNPPADSRGIPQAFVPRAVSLSAAMSNAATIQDGAAAIRRVAPDVKVVVLPYDRASDYWATNAGPAVVFHGTSWTAPLKEYDVGIDTEYITVTH